MASSQILIYLLMGSCGGFLAGLFGIGGGMVLVPLMTILFSARQFPAAHIVHMAIATSLGIILFTSISSVRAHHKRGAVLWRLAFMFMPGILVGSWVGPMIAAALSTTMLSALFAVFVGFSALQMLFSAQASAQAKSPASSDTTRQLPALPGMLAAGAGIGTLSGMVGAGGGFISVPFMTWCNVPIHRAVATSAALGFPIALAGTLSNIYHGLHLKDLPSGSIGYIYLPTMLTVALASMLTAPFGAKAAHAMPVARLKKAFAGLLLVLAGYMLWKALHV